MKIYYIISTAMLVATTTADTQNQNLRGARDRSLAYHGSSSCTGDNNECKGNEGTIGNEACQGDYDDVDDMLGVCQLNKGTIHDQACKGSGVSVSCYDNRGEIGYSACHGKDVCQSNKEGATIGMVACVGSDDTCSFNFGTIGFAACWGNKACYNNRGTIGEEACMGDNACYGNSGTIEPGCCTEDNWIPQCNYNKFVIAKRPGSNECEQGEKKPGEQCDENDECLFGYACEKPLRSDYYYTEPKSKVCCNSKETMTVITHYGWYDFCESN